VHPPRTTDLETSRLLKNQHPDVIAWTGPNRLHSRKIWSCCSKGSSSEVISRTSTCEYLLLALSTGLRDRDVVSLYQPLVTLPGPLADEMGGLPACCTRCFAFFTSKVAEQCLKSHIVRPYEDLSCRALVSSQLRPGDDNITWPCTGCFHHP